MTNKNFQIFGGLSIEDLKNSEDVVGDAVKAVANQGGAVGAILNHALGLTGSEGKAFSDAVQSYSNAYNPIFSKMIEALQDEQVRKEVIDRLAKRHHASAAVRNKKDK